MIYNFVDNIRIYISAVSYLTHYDLVIYLENSSSTIKYVFINYHWLFFQSLKLKSVVVGTYSIDIHQMQNIIHLSRRIVIFKISTMRSKLL